MKFKEIVQMNQEERKTKLLEHELELIKLNTQVATGTPPKNAGNVSKLKKEIAKILLANKMAKNVAKNQQNNERKIGENKNAPKKAVKKQTTK